MSKPAAPIPPKRSSLLWHRHSHMANQNNMDSPQSDAIQAAIMVGNGYNVAKANKLNVADEGRVNSISNTSNTSSKVSIHDINKNQSDSSEDEDQEKMHTIIDNIVRNSRTSLKDEENKSVHNDEPDYETRSKGNRRSIPVLSRSNSSRNSSVISLHNENALNRHDSKTSISSNTTNNQIVPSSSKKSLLSNKSKQLLSILPILHKSNQVISKSNSSESLPQDSTSGILDYLLGVEADVVIGADIEIKGNLNFSGICHMHGKFQGRLTCAEESDLVLFPQSIFIGDIPSTVNRLVVHEAHLYGNVSAASEVIIIGRAIVKGDITCRALEILSHWPAQRETETVSSCVIAGQVNIHYLAPEKINAQGEILDNEENKQDLVSFSTPKIASSLAKKLQHRIETSKRLASDGAGDSLSLEKEQQTDLTPAEVAREARKAARRRRKVEKQQRREEKLLKMQLEQEAMRQQIEDLKARASQDDTSTTVAALPAPTSTSTMPSSTSNTPATALSTTAVVNASENAMENAVDDQVGSSRRETADASSTGKVELEEVPSLDLTAVAGRVEVDSRTENTASARVAESPRSSRPAVETAAVVAITAATTTALAVNSARMNTARRPIETDSRPVEAERPSAERDVTPAEEVKETVATVQETVEVINEQLNNAEEVANTQLGNAVEVANTQLDNAVEVAVRQNEEDTEVAVTSSVTEGVTEQVATESAEKSDGAGRSLPSAVNVNNISHTGRFTWKKDEDEQQGSDEHADGEHGRSPRAGQSEETEEVEVVEEVHEALLAQHGLQS